MQNLSFYLLNTEETHTVARRLTAFLNSDLSADEFVAEVYPLLNDTISDLTMVLNRIQDKEHTIKLAEDDEARDNAFIALRDYFKAFVNNPNEEMQHAAQKLTNLTRQMGWSMWDDGYVVESANLNSYIAKLEEENNQQYMQTISAISFFEYLKSCQDRFEETNSQKVNIEAATEAPLLKETKKKIAKYLVPLLSYIELRAEIRGGVYKTTADKADEVISGIMSIARARQTRKENAADKEEEANISNDASDN